MKVMYNKKIMEEIFNTRIYEWAKFAIEQLPYNDFEFHGFTDLDSEDNFVPITNKEWLTLLFLRNDIKSVEINETPYTLIVNYNGGNKCSFDIEWDSEYNRYVCWKFVPIDEILYYTQLVQKTRAMDEEPSLREYAIEFMEHNEFLTKLENEDWYNTEDALVKLLEQVSGKKDTWYDNTKGE